MLGIACFAAMGIGENVVCCGELFGGEHFGERWDLSTEYGAPGTFGEKVKSEMRLLASIENEPLFVAMPGDRHDQCNSNGTPSHPAQHSTASNPSLQLDIQLQLVREPRDGYVKICYRRVSPRTQSSRNHIFQSHTSKVPLGTMNDENHMKETPTKKKNSVDQPLRCPRALCTVALPRARPTPLPRWPRERNMGAFLSISGTMKNLTWLPRM